MNKSSDKTFKLTNISHMRWLWFLVGWLVLFVPELLRIYFIMPFPGSQQEDTVSLAYFLWRNILFIRLAGILIIGYPLYWYLARGKWYKKVAVLVPTILYLGVYFIANFVAQADKMFLQPIHKVFVPADSNAIDMNNYVIGVSLAGESKAYPIQIIGYHHQVRDTVGGTPLIVTYCTVCRSGRVYSPVLNGANQTLRLVGMDHFNAMFEDSATGSWWRQENGEAIAGPLRGQSLATIPSYQMTLRAWLHRHPNSLIMQRDTTFNEAYDSLKGYDRGTRASSLVGTDTAAWGRKSWVVGVSIDSAHAKAYSWNDLKSRKVINDTIGNVSVLITLDSDSLSFHALNRKLADSVLYFEFDLATGNFVDISTHSIWNADGLCTGGALLGAQLLPLEAYQEFWHSWKQFHPQTTAWNKK